ncbi:MAG: T9SS type A sorting domain-containing protein [bacterium]
MKKVTTTLLVAIIATLFIGRANAQSPTVNFLKSDPIFGGIIVKYQVTGFKAPAMVTFEYSGSYAFPKALGKITTDSIFSDTTITDTITVYNNAKLPAPPSVFYGRYRLQDTLGTDTVSNVLQITSLPIPVVPTIDTVQISQNVHDTVFSSLILTSNVKGMLHSYFANGPTNFFDPSNHYDSASVDSGTNVNYSHIIPGTIPNSYSYVGYIFTNPAGSDTLGVMKIAPYVTQQKPNGAMIGVSCKNKQITVDVKVFGFDLTTTCQIKYGTTSATLTDTIRRVIVSGKGMQLISFTTTDSLKANTTYYFQVRLSNSKGYTDLQMVSYYIGSDPAVFTLTTDTGWTLDIDPVNGKVSVKCYGSYQLATNSTSASIRAFLASDTTTAVNSSSWTTTGSAGSTPVFLFQNQPWSKAIQYFVKIIGEDDLGTFAKGKWIPVFMTTMRPYSLMITKVTVNKSGRSADVTCKYVNTEKVTSDNVATYDSDSTFANFQTTSLKTCIGDSGTVTFTIPVSKDTYYWVKVSGANTIGDHAVSNVMKFKLNLSAFSYTITNIAMDNVGKKATVYIHYQNTEGTTSTVYVKLDKNSNFSSPITSDPIACLNDSGSAWFTVSNLDADCYYVVATGDNSDQVHTTSGVAYFQLNTKPYVGIETIEKDIMSVYPNPTSEQVIIDFNDSYTAPFVLIDLKGQIVLNKRIVAGERIDVSTFPRGMYVYRVGEKTGKLLLQ